MFRQSYYQIFWKNNYLEGQALQIVKEINNIDDIWDRLKTSFGNVEILLNNKLDGIESDIPLWKIRNDEKLIHSITKLINRMKELRILAEKHKIEEDLFHASNLGKIAFFDCNHSTAIAIGLI